MKVTRKNFIKKHKNESFDLKALKNQRGVSSSTVRKAKRADLNRDGKIEGKKELNRLFSEIDKFDRDGSPRSVETSKRGGGLSRVGKALESLEKSTNAASSSSASPRRFNRDRSNHASDSSRSVGSGSVSRASINTRGMSESQKYDFYKNVIEENGGKFKGGTNRRNLLSFRKETDADVRGGKGRYDDTTIMLWQDRRGRKHVKEYKSNTEPSAWYRGREGVDVNHDGKKDLGRLAAGYYEYKKSYSARLGHSLKPVKSAMAERDTNQDGLFNDDAFGSAGRSILFHKGNSNRTGSAGCQTLPPREFNRFWKDINSAGNPGTIGYTLINLK